MNTRRIATAVGIAAGGALAAGFLSTATASAAPAFNVFGFDTDGATGSTAPNIPGTPLTVVTSNGGFLAAPDFATAKADSDVLGFLGLDLKAAGTGTFAGSFDVSETAWSGWTSTTYGLNGPLNWGDIDGLGVPASNLWAGTGTAPIWQEGSVLNEVDFGGGWGSIYAVIITGSGTTEHHDVVTAMLTPFGDFDTSWATNLLGPLADITTWGDVL